MRNEGILTKVSIIFILQAALLYFLTQYFQTSLND